MDTDYFVEVDCGSLPQAVAVLDGRYMAEDILSIISALEEPKNGSSRGASGLVYRLIWPNPVTIIATQRYSRKNPLRCRLDEAEATLIPSS
jgi:hypothetical protein